jgi:hypothetical protein
MKIHLLFALAFYLIRGGALAAEPAAPSVAATAPVAQANEELMKLYREDQADRSSKDGTPIDWKAVAARDAVRLKRVKELYSGDQLKTGGDYYHAAMILQHGDSPEDYLLCHELCVAALAKGSSNPKSWFSSAKWLAAASEDRFLLSIGRPQRFGTQSTSKGPMAPRVLDKVQEGVTDVLRRDMGVPPLSEAKAQIAKENDKRK